MKLSAFVLAFFIILFTSCTTEKDSHLKISVNSWIGYSPIIYANNKGWLEPYDIKIVEVTSLAESLYIYDAKNADVFTGTQYEYMTAKETHKNLTPIIMIDKSYGGDMVMSNRTIQELVSSTSQIDTYLEINSINSIVLKDFLQYYKIDEDRINYINQDPSITTQLKNTPSSKETLIVTYTPSDILLANNGFKTISSTRDETSISVVDAIYADQDIYLKHKEKFEALKEKIAMAIEVSQKDPREYYRLTKHYLQDISYEEFEASLKNIKWEHKELSDELKKILIKESFPIDGLI